MSLAMACTALTLGCSPAVETGHLDVQSQPPAPTVAELDYTSIVLSHGVVAAFHFTPLRDGRAWKETPEVVLLSTDEEVVEIYPVVDTEQSYLVRGVAVGEAEIEVWLNGEWSGVMPVSIVSQEPTELE
jgi:hypothetical protein